MSEELRECPFCGGLTPGVYGGMIGNVCDKCGACLYDPPANGFSARPIEDELRRRIGELEAQNARLKGRGIEDMKDCIAELENRIVELDGYKERWRSRAVAAEAKLARVKEWRDSTDIMQVENGDFGRLDAILSDTRKPLAVVEGYVWADFAEEFARYAFSVAKDQVDDFDDADSVHTPVTVIVLPKEGDNGVD